MTSASVVGAGPNGLAAAVVLAAAGVDVVVYEANEEIGGGTRSSDVTGTGVLHDHCSAAHPFALVSAFSREYDLGRAKLRWIRPEIDVAHPLDDGSAGIIEKDLSRTADQLAARDAKVWKALFWAATSDPEALFGDVSRPLMGRPRHPLRLGAFGVPALASGELIGRLFTSPRTKALWAGIAAHAFHPLGTPLSAAPGLLLAASAQNPGWVVAEGGSQRFSAAMADLLTGTRGRIETGRRVKTLSELPATDLTLLDLAPGAVADLAGERLPPKVAKAYRRWKHGPAAFKLDLTIDGEVPWRDEKARRAGTVHVGGTIEEIAAAELETWQGRPAERPFVLVCQQYVADPCRSRGNLHPVWSYAHVPHGYTGDASEAILDQIERFAPGLRERIVARHVTSPAQLQADNANLVGGDVSTGANTPRQLVFRPRFGLNPYATGIAGVYLCSAATPPGAGAHGMCGYNAAKEALRYLEGR